MSARHSRLLQVTAALMFLSLAMSFSPAVLGQQKPKEPLWTHAFDLKCRKYGESEFTDKTQKFGVEAFKDTNTGSGLYVSQAGSFAAAPGFESITSAIKNSKGPEWVAGLDLPCRKAGEKEFTKDTKIHAMEVFLDQNTNNFVYITEKALMASCPVPKGYKAPSGGLMAPKWLHSVDLSCRKGGVKEWKDALKFGLEIYRDLNTGNIIYITDTGAIAVLHEKIQAKVDGKAPSWLHGLDLQCRQHNEMDFTKKTRKFGIEVFRDETNGNLIYICESGDLAVVPAPIQLTAPTSKVKEPVWTHGLNLSCRKSGEPNFTDKTRVYGAEVFRDDNTGLTLYITETGSLAAVPTK
ncbi:MAG: hypothetical protein FJ271_23995 [Planctomycetes bacterium]|nr:hypothetical protein [Planctomycetota bacterium]